MEQTLDVALTLERGSQQVLAAAEAAVRRARLAHYDEPGGRSDGRFETLLDVVISSCRDHRLEPAVAYAESLAARRHEGGYPFAEVQTALNALEEAVWRYILAVVPAESQGQALALVSTVLGSVKDILARSYVDSTDGRPSRPLHLESLFAGAEGSPRHR